MNRWYVIKNDIKHLMIIDIIILIMASITGLAAGMVSGWTVARIFTPIRSVCCVLGGILLLMAAMDLIRKKSNDETSDKDRQLFRLIPYRYILIQAGTVALILGIIADKMSGNVI